MRVAAVGGDTNSRERTGQEAEMLLVGNFKSVYFRTLAVKGLGQDPPVVLRSVDVRRDQTLHAFVDRIGKLFVEETRLQQAQRFQILFVQQVVIVCPRWLEVGIADIDFLV